MNSLALIILTGRLGKEPELNYSATGVAYTKFSIAVDTWDGKQNVTSWYNIVCFGKKAETCNDLLHRGSLIAVQGVPMLQTYTDKEGTKRQALSITANDITFLSGFGKSRMTEDEPIAVESVDDESRPF